MFSKKLLFSSLLAAAALLTEGTAEVRADPIRTSGVICDNAIPGQGIDFQRFNNEFTNVNATLIRAAVCPIPRSPPVPAGAGPLFMAAGRDANCILTSYQPNGAVTAVAAFAWPAAGAIVAVTFTPALAPPQNFITLSCNVNPGGAIISLAAAN